MAREIPVFSILQLFFSNIFSLLVLFIFGFMFSYFFSSDLLGKKYTTISYIEIGSVEDQRLASVGSILNQLNSSSFNAILKENYDVPEVFTYSVRISEDNLSQLELVVTSENPENVFQVQNILLSMLRDLEENKYKEYIQNIKLRITQNENFIKGYELDFEKITEDITALPSPDGGESGALVAYLNLSNSKKNQIEAAQKMIEIGKRKIETAKRTSYLTSPKVKKDTSFSYPNSKTHLGVGFLLALLSIIYLLYREFKKSRDSVLN